MTATLNTEKPCVTPAITAVDSLTAIADELTACGFSAHDPAGDGSAHMKLTNARGALCELTITSVGAVTWDYRSYDGNRIDSRHLAALFLDLLDPNRDDDGSTTAPHRAAVTLKGAVGMMAARHGMRVKLDLLDEDAEFYESFAEMQITNPAQVDRGTVCVSDDGALHWHCLLQPSPASGLTVTSIAATLAIALINAGHTPRT